MRRICAALALALLTAATNVTAAEVAAPLVPVPAVAPAPAVPHGCCGGCCGASCLQRLWGWMTYHALPVSPCCRVWITPRYCYPPTNTFFIRTCPHGPPVNYAAQASCANCAATHPSAAPAPSCQNGSCGGPPPGALQQGQLSGR